MRVTGEVNTGPWEDVESTSSWVPALPEKRPTATAYPIVDAYPNYGPESHLAALETVKETATPFDRAIGLVIRTAPFAVIWLALAVGLFVAMDGDLIIPFLLFAGLTAITYFLLNGQEYRHSASGLERHKADLAHDLQVMRIDNDHELRSKALDSYIKHLEKGQ